MKFSIALIAFAFTVGTWSNSPLRAAEEARTPHVQQFLSDHCLACHEGEFAEAGLDLSKIGQTLTDPAIFAKWVSIVDRVHDKEMPPEEGGDVPAPERKNFVQTLSQWLDHYQQTEQNSLGRVRGRRLTNLQVERTLHDLLGIDIPLAIYLPDDPRPGYTTLADGQPMSHFQLQDHLEVVDRALEEAMRRAVSKPDEWVKDLDAEAISRTRPKARCREPELIGDRAVVWSSRLIFYGRLPATTARDGGWYRFRVRAEALKNPEGRGVWCTVRTGPCVSSAPLLGWVGAFEAFPDKLGEWTFETWLPDGHMLEIRPGDTTLKMARFEGGQVGAGEGGPQDVPGIAIESIRMQRFHRGPDNDQIRKWLFGKLEVKRSKHGFEVISKHPKKDAEQLLTAFARRAFRRPVDHQTLRPYVDLVNLAIDDGQPFHEAIRSGYRALLCSPRFLYFSEEPGQLDDYAIASRLSYFLWNSMPDETLMTLAADGRLHDETVLHTQIDRLLDDPRGEHFIEDFAAEWLDLSEIDFTEPDRRLYPTFDVIVQNSMLAETHAFLNEMLKKDLSVTRLIDSDETYLNSRLARFYDIDDVSGDELRKVHLSEQDHRGGILTHGSILKVTANGSNTSPVIRGAWVCERLLGEKIPPPPEDIPAIEPDIRGATTIREMLAKHTSDISCARCHVKMDPVGFALENFDPAGQWRESYSVRKGKDRKINASAQLPDGREFNDIDGFRQLLLSDPDALAANVASQLIAYGTGAEVEFADRDDVQQIVRETSASDFGFRSILHAVATSPIFLSK